MSDLTSDLKQELANLYTLRDQVRVRLHLCGQEAKDKWSLLETELERAQDNATRATKHSLSELGHKLREFGKRIEDLSS